MTGLRRRIESWPAAVHDVGIVLVLLAIELPLPWVYASLDLPGRTGPTVLGALLVMATILPLVFRRRAPLTVLVVTVGLGMLTVPLGVASELFGPLVALYTVAARSSRGRSVAALALALGGGSLLAAGDALGLARLITNVVVVATAWLLGDAQRNRQAQAALLAERAAQLDAEREHSAVLAVAEERARIARELHDVVAHTVSVMVVQAGAARRVLPTDQDGARAAAHQVAVTGRLTLHELRRLLGLLHDEDAPADLVPQPALADLDHLVAQFAGTPLRVRLRTTGAPNPLSPGVELSVYRIVQESLTNALKHSGATRVDVHVDCGHAGIAIEVSDDGRGPQADGVLAGHGLVGMRERAALLGGTLEVGPRRGGGCTVTALLPAEVPA